METTEDFIKFTPEEFQRFNDALVTCYAFPFIDSIEDYIVEAMLEYARCIDGIDPLLAIRSKKLYDVVDEKSHIGWSVKSVQISNVDNRDFELVIQRADIFKKAKELGFDSLTKDSPTADLGAALMKHWGDKVDLDAIDQNVKERRIFILLKSRKNALNFAIYEAPLVVRNPQDLVWEWTNESKTGLQGRDKKTGRCVHRWYPGQKQLFECFSLPEKVKYFTINPTRLQKEEVVGLVTEYLRGRQ